MIAEFPIYLGVKLSTAQHTVVRTLAARECTTISAIVREMIEREARRDLQNDGAGAAD